MFSALRQNASVYVLDKSGTPTLKIGQVSAVTQPQPKFGQYPLSQETTIDLLVKYDDGTTNEFKMLPSSMSSATFGNVIITETKELMSAEVENMLRTSQSALDSVPYHEEVVEETKKMLCTLNPSYKKEKETDERLHKLEDGLEDIKSMLVKALNKQQPKQ